MMSEKVRSWIVPALLTALLGGFGTALLIMWNAKADCSAVDEQIRRVEDVTEVKIEFIKSAQTSFEKRLERIETKVDDIPDKVIERLRAK